MELEKVIAGLIKGRHEMPVENYIFNDSIENVHNYESIRKHIEAYIRNNVGIETYIGQPINGNDYTDIECLCESKQLEVYVTGLTPVTVELVAACARFGVTLTLRHYNTATGGYEAQSVLL